MFQKTKKYILVFYLVLSSLSVFALSENAKISVLTFEPGQELYTIFGHSAIRIQDSILQIDRIYNFGTFDYSSPFFYIKFLGGKLDYFLSVVDFQTFYYYSVLEKRTIYEQIINLSYKDKIAIYNRLNQIYHSKDRYYRYDFFYDNCATRIRDVIEENTQNKLQYDTASYCCKTFRDLLNPYVSERYWIDLGINLALGKQADRTASSSDVMFLPDYIFKILRDSGSVKKSFTLIEFPHVKNNHRILSYALLVIILFLILLFSAISRTRRFTFYFYNSAVALVGLILSVLSLFSENAAFRNNMDIFWTIPAIFVLILEGKYKRWYTYIYLYSLVVLILFGNKIYAGFSPAYQPWIICLIIIYAIDISKNRQKLQLSS